jgi:hypothetical protein
MTFQRTAWKSLVRQAGRNQQQKVTKKATRYLGEPELSLVTLGEKLIALSYDATILRQVTSSWDVLSERIDVE